MPKKEFGNTKMGESLGCAAMILAVAIPFVLILILLSK
jgi:hypothetical protein